jgi:dTDP-4-amino-4,6-dideoxygalactose transaminase
VLLLSVCSRAHIQYIAPNASILFPINMVDGAAVRMWPRKQIDVGWSDLAFGLAALRRHDSPHAAEIVGPRWFPPQEALVSLSVRTGWDLLLAALRWPPGSEIIFTSPTIPDMVRIAEHHRLVPVPVGVDAGRLEPALADLERIISARTKAILVAHLFGSRIDMDSIVRLAKPHRLCVVEDCAQLFVGPSYAGHQESVCCLFSFGPIKTATALGGAVLRVRDNQLRARMSDIQREYRFQSRWSYFARLLKYAAIRQLSAPHVYGALAGACRILGIDFDRAFGNAAHSFAAANFFEQIRKQPSGALRRMLQRRIASFEQRGAVGLRRRAERGNRLARRLPGGMVVGAQNPTHTYWVVPVRIGNAAGVITELRRAGFDATGRSSMADFAPSRTPGATGADVSWLAGTIYLPNGDAMPDGEWQRMATILCDVASASPPRYPSELSAAQRVSVM